MFVRRAREDNEPASANVAPLPASVGSFASRGGEGGRMAPLRPPIAERSPQYEEVSRALAPQVQAAIDPKIGARLARGELARVVSEIVTTYLNRNSIPLDLHEQRDLVSELLNGWLQTLANQDPLSIGLPPRNSAPGRPAPRSSAASAPSQSSSPQHTLAPTPRASAERSGDAGNISRATVEAARDRLQPIIMSRIDVMAAAKLSRPELERQIGDLIPELLTEARLQLNLAEKRDVIDMILDDMLGLGPLEPLLADETITDIMVNGPRQVYVERRGKLDLTDVRFRDDPHVMNIATRIVSRIGRRVDETNPLVDARLADGSRVNIIIPPLAIDGPSISIRKFSKKWITLDIMAQQENMSPQMATLLKIASRCRMNILISGGTGSGKTTLLNAMSHMIDGGERVVTIEDAAELQLQQPHVVRLETRPPNVEGRGEITMRDLVKNALRMRPDRIILGETRGAEAIDMLQAMNTGHEGSMSTVHANRPREALTRLENMVGMSGINLPSKAVRTQIAAAINIIVQIARMRDGVRRVIQIVEVVGMEGDVITTQDLFNFQYQGEGQDGRLRGVFKSTGIRPHFLPKAEYFGLDRALMEAM